MYAKQKWYEKFLPCKHRWKVHKTTVYRLEEERIVKGTEHWFRPAIEKLTGTETTEILICEKCGKIQTLKYFGDEHPAGQNQS